MYSSSLDDSELELFGDEDVDDDDDDDDELLDVDRLEERNFECLFEPAVELDTELLSVLSFVVLIADAIVAAFDEPNKVWSLRQSKYW